MRTNGLLALALLALVGCNPAPTYLEAHGHFGDGTPIDFREGATLVVGQDQTGANVAYVRSVDTASPAFMGMVVWVDLDQVTAPGQYPTSHDGSGGAQLRLLVPGADFLDTVEYTADGTLDILELPTGGNDRFAGSFTGVRVDYDGQDITVDQGHFRGQL